MPPQTDSDTRHYRSEMIKHMAAISRNVAKIHRDLERTQQDLFTHLLITKALTTISNEWDERERDKGQTDSTT